MKKKVLIITLSILLAIGLLIIVISENKKVYIEIEGVKYAILVDGEISNSFPSGNYMVDINCTNARSYWNNITRKVVIKNIKGNVKCDISFSSISSSDYLNDYLINLLGTTQGEGELVLENGYRYEGKKPNNYIMFNNELWRIIGVFSTEYDSNNSGAANTTKDLVKIINEESIGSLLWNNNSNNRNSWPNSSLYNLLNKPYYKWNTNKNSVASYCYSGNGSPIIPVKCDYSVKGIQDGYRNMIVKAKWYLGGGGKSGYTTYTPDSVYSYERDANAVYSNRAASTLGYIGLMYASDYLYGVLASDCSRDISSGSYGNANCAGKNWLYGKGYEWTITPNSSNGDSAWYFEYGGCVYSNSAYYGFNVRPTLYLSPDVYRVSGTGTITDPYIIGMAS